MYWDVYLEDKESMVENKVGDRGIVLLLRPFVTSQPEQNYSTNLSSGCYFNIQ